jgi:hypothetical protein
MPVIQNTVASALHVIDLPDRACFTTWREFIESIPRYIGVEVPASVSGVIVGPDVPGEGDKDKVWFRRDRSGAFLGIYAFQAGAWRKLIQTLDSVTDIFWVVGDSTNPPDGFTVIEEGDPTMPASTALGIRSQFLPNPIGPGFNYFAMRFSGY